MIRRFVLAALLVPVAAGFVALGSEGRQQGKPRQGTVSGGKTATQGTTTTKTPPPPVVTLKLMVAGKTATARVRSSDCVTVTMENGRQLMLLPVLKNEAVSLAVWVRAPKMTDGGCNAANATARYSLAAGTPVNFVLGAVQVRAEFPRGAAPATKEQVAGGTPCSRCCVTCDGITWCACEVVTECGRCCCPDACGCDPVIARAAKQGGVRA